MARKSSGHIMKCGLCHEPLAPEEPIIMLGNKEVCTDCQTKDSYRLLKRPKRETVT